MFFRQKKSGNWGLWNFLCHLEVARPSWLCFLHGLEETAEKVLCWSLGKGRFPRNSAGLFGAIVFVSVFLPEVGLGWVPWGRRGRF